MADYKNVQIDDALIDVIRHMYKVDEYRELLQRLQAEWDNLTLLGQLSGTGMDMSGTRESFHALTGQLLGRMADEVLRTRVIDCSARAQIAIDILVRNLFERTADIGFLSTDDEVRQFLVEAIPLRKQFDATSRLLPARELLRKRFAEYVAKYSVYSDVILLATDGEVMARLDEAVGVVRCQHPLVEESLSSTSGFVESFGEIDLLPGTKDALIYSWRVVDERGSPLGVLCLSFRFANEMAGIFSKLVGPDDWNVVTLIDRSGMVVSSSDEHHIPRGAVLKPVVGRDYAIARFRGQEYLAVTRPCHGYQGYGGPPWFGHVMLPLGQAFHDSRGDLPRGVSQEVLTQITRHSDVFGEALRAIPQKAALIQRDLNRSVWNGNVRIKHSGGTDSSSFSKILLWEVSKVGRKTQEIFQRSIDELHETVVSAVMHDSRAQAALAIDIMDRNLYERANDCRWWALSPAIRMALSSGDADGPGVVQSVLRAINDLYTVYTNLIVFDARGRIVAVSNVQAQGMIGQHVGDEWAERVLRLGDSQKYAVSRFAETPYYDGRATYIYGSVIRHSESSQVVGGIGVVFDAEPQFRAMLIDSLPRNDLGEIANDAFGVIVEPGGRIVSCSDGRYAAGDKFELRDGAELLSLSPGC